MIYYGFPRRLHHTVPHWVERGALFHIRIALDREKGQRVLIELPLGRTILHSVKFYESKARWFRYCFPVNARSSACALLSFAPDESMSAVIGDWKRFHAGKNHVMWQKGYFDHRLRDDERGEQLVVKINYIRQNPVVAGLCTKAEDWPWIIDRSGSI